MPGVWRRELPTVDRGPSWTAATRLLGEGEGESEGRGEETDEEVIVLSAERVLPAPSACQPRGPRCGGPSELEAA